jgi:uncharacterized protein YkwD
MANEDIQPLYNFAENVAFGASSGKELLPCGKNSSGHRKKFWGSFTYIGIGIARDKHGQIFYTQFLQNKFLRKVQPFFTPQNIE